MGENVESPYWGSGQPGVRAGHLGRTSDEIGLDSDIAVHRLGVRADPVRSVDQRLRNLTVKACQAHVEAGC
jgi:hypothetical protein